MEQPRPRVFDKWVCKDNDKITNTVPDNPLDQYAQFYTGGRHRGSANSLVYTGIGTKKFWDIKCNPKDTPGIPTNGNMYLLNPPLIRLADAYLMYAEAVSWGYGSADEHRHRGFWLLLLQWMPSTLFVTVQVRPTELLREGCRRSIPVTTMTRASSSNC